MDISRRGFLKLTGGTLAATGLGAGIGIRPVFAQPRKLRYTKEVPSICPYCAVGCGVIVHVREGKVVNAEGDPDHPISKGSLCSKGSALYQVVNNKRRLAKPLYRAPRSSTWKEVSWDWALDRIAGKVKDARDKGFIHKNSKGQVVNRVENMVCLGGASLDNEEVYPLVKFARALGLVYIEHQARI